MGKVKETYGKKEIAKKKIQNRRDKEERKEQRKASSSKGKGIDAMMAYIDENGNLSATPPDPSKKKEIKQEDIELSVSKYREEARESAIKAGILISFNKEKGFGFIREMNTQNSFFVHMSEMLEPVAVNDKVNFEVAQDKRGMHAIQMRKKK